MSGTGFAPGSSGDVLFASTPVKVGTFTADSAGGVSVQVAIPATAVAGPHHLILRGTDPTGAPREVSVGITVTAPALARTGRGLDLVLMGGMALVGLGLVSLGRSFDRGARLI